MRWLEGLCPGPLRRLVLALLVLALPVCSAQADEYEVVPLDRNAGFSTAYRFHARVLGTPAGVRPGGQGYVRIELINPTDKSYAVNIEITSNSHGSAGIFGVRRGVQVAAESRLSLDLPVSNTPWSSEVSFVVDGRENAESINIRSSAKHRNRTLVALHVGSSNEGGWEAYLHAEAERRHSVRSGADVYSRLPSELPDSWTLLSGFDLILAHAGAEGLTPERQQVLLRYVAGGGNLIVTAMDDQVSGPLLDLMRSAQTEEESSASGHHGLGRWIMVGADADAQSEVLRRWLEAGSLDLAGALDRVSHAHGGPAPDVLWLPLGIPGVGEVPVRAFFLLILLFVILVGPVSYIYFRRRRRLAMLLVTIPLAGFLCAGAVLGYGIYSEGFGIVGSMRSFTVLDQRTQVASVMSGRTLYAGLQPDSLTPSADTVLVSGAADPGALPPTLDVTSGQRIDGSVLPSRTPTPLVATTVGRSRERLRFRRQPDGDYEVLAAPGLVPLAGDEAFLFRAPDGEYFMAAEDGDLKSLLGPGHSISYRVDAVLVPLTLMPLGSGDVTSDDPWDKRARFRTGREMQALAASTTPLSKWLRSHIGSMPPGSYLARVRQAPLIETLGLDVTYRSEEHVVMGLLGPEDVVDE